MRCIVCHRYSFPIVCRKCQQTLLSPTLSTRRLTNGFKVYSFYRYKEIDILLKTKHSHIGAAVYTILAENALGWFKREFAFESLVGVVPVDDTTKSGYSHTAILAKALRTETLKPMFGALRAKNDVNYSAKTLKYRQQHPRGFEYAKRGVKDLILVDDIITTGTTLNEARKVVEGSGATPLFALTLADAREL